MDHTGARLRNLQQTMVCVVVENNLPAQCVGYDDEDDLLVSVLWAYARLSGIR